MCFLSAYYATLTLGARDFSSAISCFCQVFVVTRYPWYQRLFLASDQELRRPQSDSTRAAKSREKTSGAEALIYCTGWTLTLSLICQSNRRSLANRPFPSSPGPLYQNEVRCSTFDMEQAMEMIFHSHANKTHFHKKG